ncbi:putative RNA methylase [Beutenbergia cavernae DSM 12333]|uniref:Putative RNA methylase n=1 Tax=Beutenbergia cavernae (strain ATCC BAA-8 / DSM 12333 / CCUG 43141 / JCM 11478 / NBRC 16432 / NCIMB 13614 / HKI 0122) TaxID=471853 RepID=C5BVP3_BEUC1|nr:putative RNA methylase [Beutenbergia cavernae DSM 12333]
MKVLGTHTAGLGELVAESLRADVRAEVLYADDSAALVSTGAPESAVAQLSYLKNAFVVLGSTPRRGDLRQAVEKIARAVPAWGLRRTGRQFRLTFSEDGRLAAVPAASRVRLETAVARATGGRFTPRGGGAVEEYWTITRRDLDEVLFARRIARPPRPAVPKGSLAPEIAELVVNAAGPAGADDVVLDPFAGSGALVAARVRRPFRKAICSDVGYADGTVRRLPELARAARVVQLPEDARVLASVPDGSVDVVVTDPPWGEFESGPAPDEEFFAATLTSMRRVLRPRGRLAMLLSRRLVRDVRAQWIDHGLVPEKSFDLLVNGHPATLLVGHREAGPGPAALETGAGA